MTRRKTSRSGLDRERARRRELDRSKAELGLAERAKPLQPARPQSAHDPALGPANVPLIRDADVGSSAGGVRIPGQRVACLWCGSFVDVKARGPLPKFCSATCRHRAWEQERAARAGRAAVVAVDRLVVAFPEDARTWVTYLERLADDVIHGQLDETAVAPALDRVCAAVASRRRRDLAGDPW